MQTFVNYNPHTGTLTHARDNVNAA